jgi:hypothetical protein
MYKSEESLSLDVPLIAEERKTRKMRNNGKTRYYSPLQVRFSVGFLKNEAILNYILLNLIGLCGLYVCPGDFPNGQVHFSVFHRDY